MCEHKYQVLSNETCTLSSDNGPIAVQVSATFYCEKCLDIQYRKKKVSTRVSDVND